MNDVFLESTDTVSKVARVMSLRRSDSFAYLLLGSCMLLLSIVGGASALQYINDKNTGLIRDHATGAVPVLSLRLGEKWHLFLSHIWTSGQDQVAVMKRQLQLMCPGISVFLDVDDLEDIGALEAYVDATATMMLFLSKSYFLSRNCLREVDATVTKQKHTVLVHEGDETHGGLTLEAVKLECPERLRAAVFSPANGMPIDWHRIHDFQVLSLRLLAEGTLRGTPHYATRNTRFYVSTELSPDVMVLRNAVNIYGAHDHRSP